MRGSAATVTVLAVCGLRVEARIACGPGVVTVAGGGRSAALGLAIERAIDAGATALISFGIAAALSTDLRPGDIVVADRVVDSHGDYPTDPRWTVMLQRGWSGSRSGICAGSDVLVADPPDKARLRVASGALTVDMESHIAARIADARGLPFAAVRAVTDDAATTLPAAARIAMREEGGIDLVAVLRSIAGAPGQLPRLLGIGLDTRKALRALGRGRRAVGDGLGYTDLDQLLLDVV